LRASRRSRAASAPRLVAFIVPVTLVLCTFSPTPMSLRLSSVQLYRPTAHLQLRTNGRRANVDLGPPRWNVDWHRGGHGGLEVGRTTRLTAGVSQVRPRSDGQARDALLAVLAVAEHEHGCERQCCRRQMTDRESRAGAGASVLSIARADEPALRASWRRARRGA